MFHLSIVTAEQSIYEGDIQMLVAPAVDGEIGILTNHHPIVTKLGPGGIKITKADNSEELLFTSGGYLEFNENKAILLSDVIENIDAIEATEAAAARKRAQELLKNAKDDVERDRLEKELRINMVRERLAGLGGKYGRRAGGSGSRGDSRGKEEMTFENEQK
jgi:F-type H+-transporting ATPase subunit epsilon